MFLIVWTIHVPCSAGKKTLSKWEPNEGTCVNDTSNSSRTTRFTKRWPHCSTHKWQRCPQSYTHGETSSVVRMSKLRRQHWYLFNIFSTADHRNYFQIVTTSPFVCYIFVPLLRKGVNIVNRSPVGNLVDIALLLYIGCTIEVL